MRKQKYGRSNGGTMFVSLFIILSSLQEFEVCTDKSRKKYDSLKHSCASNNDTSLAKQHYLIA